MAPIIEIQKEQSQIAVNRWKANSSLSVVKGRTSPVSDLVIHSKKGEVLCTGNESLDHKSKKRERKQMLFVAPESNGKRNQQMHVSSRDLFLMSLYYCFVMLQVQMRR